MAKALREPPPSSSVARLLDLQAASRAVARPEDLLTPSPATAHRPETEPAIPGEVPTIKREFVLTPSTDQTFSQLVDLYRRTTGTKLSSSHVARAVLRGIAHCMDNLEREARRIGQLRLPGNARGREGQREQFEQRLAEAFVAGVRAAPAIHRD